MSIVFMREIDLLGEVNLASAIFQKKFRYNLIVLIKFDQNMPKTYYQSSQRFLITHKLINIKQHITNNNKDLNSYRKTHSMSFKKLPLTSQLIQSLTSQQQVQKVYKLNATSQNICKIQPSIKKYNKLRCLILDFNYLEKIENLNSLFDLRELHLQGNMVVKIAGLETCKNLTVLNLANNNVQVIENIGHLGKLQHLDLRKNKLQKITNLQMLKQLKHLNLSYNHITSLQSLPNFSKLQTLLLNNNRIQSIPANGFTTSGKLVKLDMSHNRLVDCSFVGKLINLQTLNLANNCLKVFKVEAQLKFLEELNLQANELQSMPLLGELFPQLVILNLNHNMFCSQHQFITMISQTHMLAQIQFIEFQNTLFKVFSFDRINKKNYNQPGAKYLEQTYNIERNVKTEFGDIEDDEEDRKIRISGFYNDDLQAKMTGIKPHRAVSPATKKARGIIANQELNEIAKNYSEFMENDKRIKQLRQIYQNICTQNNIEKPIVEPLQEDNTFFTQQRPTTQQEIASQKEIAQLRLRNDNNQKMMLQAKKQKSDKWAELKAKTKEKSFNIRKSRTKEVQSSLPKINAELSQTQSRDLMKTQLVPHKFFTSKIVESERKTLNSFYPRPSSQKRNKN